MAQRIACEIVGADHGGGENGRWILLPGGRATATAMYHVMDMQFWLEQAETAHESSG
jgi:hypothetical protein